MSEHHTPTPPKVPAPRAWSRKRSLTGDLMTDQLVPLVQQLADAVFRGAVDEIAAVRAQAEDVLLVHDRAPADAGWAIAVVAAAMVPGPVSPRVLLAWLQPHLQASTSPRLSRAAAAAAHR